MIPYVSLISSVSVTGVRWHVVAAVDCWKQDWTCFRRSDFLSSQSSFLRYGPVLIASYIWCQNPHTPARPCKLSDCPRSNFQRYSRARVLVTVAWYSDFRSPYCSLELYWRLRSRALLAINQSRWFQICFFSAKTHKREKKQKQTCCNNRKNWWHT